MQDDDSYRIRHHVQLPGGRQIEVVYLDSSPSRERVPRDMPVADMPVADMPVALPAPDCNSSSTAPSEALHVCPACAGELVQPLDWVEESPGRWRVMTVCPDCDLQREGVFGEALVQRFDDELDKATSAVLDDLKRITFANMAEEIERFSRALQLDLIGPSDF
jgi:hypothetical protein